MELGLLPHGPPCTAASLPAPHPALILTELGWRAGLANVISMGAFLPALCLLLLQTGLEVTPNPPTF